MGFLLLFVHLLAALPEPITPCCSSDFWRGEVVKAAVPLKPHAKDSVEVRSISNHQRFLDWTAKEDEESYEALSKIAACWKRRSYADSFLVFGQTTPNIRSETFSWEVIPFDDSPLSTLKQISVISSVSFGTAPLSEGKRQQRGEAMREALLPLFANELDEELSRAPESDPFCNPDVINKQKIGESEHLWVLYDIRPMRLIEETPHFLIVTKAHAKDFTEISEEEYLEAMDLTRKIVSYFKKRSKNPTLYFLHKTGEPAGQTVLHWHLHVIVEENDTALIPYQFPTSRKPENATIMEEPFRQINECYRKTIQGCKNFLALTLPHRKLTDEEMKERIDTYRVIFEETP